MDSLLNCRLKPGSGKSLKKVIYANHLDTVSMKNPLYQHKRRTKVKSRELPRLRFDDLFCPFPTSYGRRSVKNCLWMVVGVRLCHF